MFEHPYLHHRLSTLETEQIVRAVERRRVIAERAEQIVPRDRIGARLRRLVHRGGGAGRAARAERRRLRRLVPAETRTDPRSMADAGSIPMATRG
ncbi:hypothetical protein GCM10025768_27210 [Microbacterium pseudoresistens]|uniref:Uncharacterized protein n=1 Tax=Microbacterium pseudoresistens TaxID=640634 RepID=A0A7Y9ETT7_9MICO|nr:hypothetical protein [Microbacterium pseudoresistens]NYD53834.1 hypothetical protein [Microbacterium pseudoresistens]